MRIPRTPEDKKGFPKAVRTEILVRFNGLRGYAGTRWGLGLPGRKVKIFEPLGGTHPRPWCGADPKHASLRAA